MASQNIISFENMSPETARNLAEGLASTVTRRLSELLNRASELQSMNEVTFSRVSELAAREGNGGCFIGCRGA